MNEGEAKPIGELRIPGAEIVIEKVHSEESIQSYWIEVRFTERCFMIIGEILVADEGRRIEVESPAFWEDDSYGLEYDEDGDVINYPSVPHAVRALLEAFQRHIGVLDRKRRVVWEPDLLREALK